MEHKNTDEDVLSLFFNTKLVDSDFNKLEIYVFLISSKFLFSLLNVELLVCFKEILEILFLSIFIFFFEFEPI